MLPTGHTGRVLIAAAACLALATGCSSAQTTTPLALTSVVSDAAAAGPCRFTVGFREFHAAIPDVIGDCKENVHADPATGNMLQATEHGLMVWRKTDGYIAFTDGQQTWVSGPSGIEVRPNNERFPWEAPAPATATVAATVTPTAGAAAAPTAVAPAKPAAPAPTSAPKPGGAPAKPAPGPTTPAKKP